MRLVQAGTFVLGAVMYALMIAFFDALSSGTYLPVNLFILGYWNTLLMVVTALVVRDAYRKVRAGETRTLATDAFVVKLVAIPFFLLNFYVLGFLELAGFGILIFGGVVLLIAVWVGIILTYLAMLSTSVYVWAAIGRLRRDRTIGTGLAVLYTILAFTFVADIAAAVLLFGHSRKRPGLALVFTLLGLGILLIVPGVLLNLAGLPDDLFGDIVTVFDGIAIAGAAVIVTTIVVALIRRSTLRRRVSGTVVDEVDRA